MDMVFGGSARDEGVFRAEARYGGRNDGYSPLNFESATLADSARAIAPTGVLPPGRDQLDIVQFTTAIFLVDADEGRIECEIMRIGQLKGSISVSYRTEGISALPGTQFQMVSGRINIGHGEHHASIIVPIFNDPHWNPTTDFKLILSEPEGCRLGHYLKTARVRVVDATKFPSNRFKALVDMGDEGIKHINKYSLFASFTYLMWFSPGAWWRTLLTLFLDAWESIYLWIRLKVSIVLVDVVLENDDAESREERVATSYLIGFLILAPQILLYLVELVKIRIDITGHLQQHLSRCMFRKFMNYSAESQMDVPPADMIASLTQDSYYLAASYSKVLQIARLCGKLVVFTFFALHQNPGTWPIIILVPILMIAWGYKREFVYMEARVVAEDKESALVRFVHEMVGKLGIVADYHQRPIINDLFAKKSEDYRRATVPENLVMYNNVFATRSVGPALVALYIVIGSELVVQGQLKTGVFLATLSVFGDICSAFSEVFSLGMNVVSNFHALKEITSLMNKEIEVPTIKKINRQRRAETKRLMMHEIVKPVENGSRQFVPAADRLEIRVKDMTFAHPGHDALDGFVMANLFCPQGSICSVVGHPGQGVNTIMDLVGHKLFPSQGFIFVPSHLRVLIVSADPVLLNMSAWQNLTFGNPKGSDPYRVERVLKRMKMEGILALCAEELAARKREISASESQHSLAELSHEDGCHEDVNMGANPLEKLSGTQIALIHLARAFIANPEFMVLHSPFMHFPKDIDDMQHIMQAMREHRDNRGFEMTPATVDSRRPRTIFFNPHSHLELELSDLSWVMPSSPGGKIEIVQKSDHHGIMSSHKSAPWQHHHKGRVTSAYESAPQPQSFKGRRYAEASTASSTFEEVILL